MVINNGVMGDTNQAPDAAEAVSLPVTGMTCAACAANIDRALKKLPGVTPDRRQLRHQPRDPHL